MLPWLPKKLSKSDIFFAQLAFIILCGHILFLGAYFWASRTEPLTIKMSVNMLRPGVPVRVIPFMKRTGNLQKLEQRSQKAVLSSKKNAKQKRLEKKDVSKKTSVKKVSEKKELVKKNIKKTEKIKPVEKNKVPDKKVEKKEPIKQEPPKPVTSEQPVQVKSEQIQSEQIKSAVVTPEVNKEELSPSEAIEEIVVGQQEYEMMQLYQEIHDELSGHWHPPAGLVPEKHVILLVSLGEKGVVDELIVEQPSGILVYDMAARMAVSKTQFPKNIWGQQIRLHF